MKKLDIICDCCQKNKATIKDFRFIDNEINGKLLVCEKCFNLNDVDFYKIYKKGK